MEEIYEVGLSKGDEGSETIHSTQNLKEAIDWANKEAKITYDDMYGIFIDKWIGIDKDYSFEAIIIRKENEKKLIEHYRDEQ